MNIFIDYSSTSDSDFDGIVDSDDDYANNPARSVECAAGKFGRHYCQDAYPGHKVTSAGEALKKLSCWRIPSRLWSDFM